MARGIARPAYLFVVCLLVIAQLLVPVSTAAQEIPPPSPVAPDEQPPSIDEETSPVTFPGSDEVATDQQPDLLKSPTPDPFIAPGLLKLSTSRYLITAGEEFTVTVQVFQDAGASVEGSQLHVTIPDSLQLLKGEPTWTLPALDDEKGFSHTFTLQLLEGQLADVFRIEAQLTASGYLPNNVNLLLGVDDDAPIKILLDPESTSAGIATRTTIVHAPEIEKAATYSIQISPTLSQTQYLPLIVDNHVEHRSAIESDIEGDVVGDVINDEGIDFYGLWQVDALKDDTEVERLDQRATIIISAKPFIAQKINPNDLEVWTRHDQDEPWQLVLSEYDAIQEYFIVHTNHFSQWGLGDGMTASGELLPSMRPFQSDRFSGDATVSYPIEAPVGVGGLTPNLSLTYGSGVVDDLQNTVGDFLYSVQGSWTGFGWNLSGASYIAHDFGSNKYFLVLNGVSVETKLVNNRWVTNPEQFWRIDHGIQFRDLRHNVDPWVVTTQDGTRYIFGSTQFDGDGEPIGNWTEVLFRNFYDQGWGGWKTFRSGSKWHLKEVVDPLGNRMEYSYDVETGGIGSNCIQRAWYPDYHRYYDRATYLSEVKWNANANQGLAPTFRIYFQRQTRPDWAITNYNNSCNQARYGNQRLQSAWVQVWDFATNSWSNLNVVVLSYEQSQFHSLLKEISRYGKDGSPVLHTYTFGYTGGHNTARLTVANNGQGGASYYGYGHEFIHDCYNCGGIQWASGIPQRRPVASIDTYDGIGGGLGNRYRVAYTYSGVKGHNTSSGYEYLGHEWASITVNIPNSETVVERFEEMWFLQRSSSSTIHPARGRNTFHHVRSNHNSTLYQVTENNWEAVQMTAGVDHYWARQNWTKTLTYGSNGGAGAGSGTFYEYEPTYQGNTQYGLVTKVVERDYSDNVLRWTRTEYFPNTSAYILNQPGRVRVHDAANTCVSEMRIYHDGQTGYATPPLSSRVTKTQQPLDNCGSNNVISTIYGYDGYGNRTGEGVESTLYNVATVYDNRYHIFPIERYNTNNSSLRERAQYYGVNGLELSAAGSYWGRMAEFCAIDNFCTRQRYDAFGRPLTRWQQAAKNSAWAAETDAQTHWTYHSRGAYGQQANIVVEWNSPRCYGNFTRKLYNGLGWLVQTQGSDQNWTTNIDNCNPGQAGAEWSVDYQYNAGGQLLLQSVPVARGNFTWAASAPWPAEFNQGKTETIYDPLYRPAQTIEPNGNLTFIWYGGRATSWRRDNGSSDKIIRWQEMDELGRLKYVRNYAPNGSGGWVQDAEILNSYKPGTDLLSQVQYKSGTGSYTTLSTMGYDLAGRKTSMSDANLSNPATQSSWRYAYDLLGNLTRQTDARNKSTCLVYDSLQRLDLKTVYHNSACSGTKAVEYDYGYDTSGRLSSIAQTTGSGWTKTFGYNGYGLLSTEQMVINGAGPTSKTLTHYYDRWLRPYATGYPDGEVVKVSYNGLGLPKLLCASYWNSSDQSYWCTGAARYADNASYDVSGRLTQVQYPAGGLWRTQSYYPWTGQGANGGMLQTLKVGTTQGGSNILNLTYSYDRFGNVASLNDNGSVSNFGYDAFNRLTSAYGQSFSYWSTGRFNTFNGATYVYGSFPFHAVDKVNGLDLYNYDDNGNMTVRNMGLPNRQNLTWNAENRLEQVTNTSGGVVESYAYDDNGQRIRRTAGNTTTYTFFDIYEEERTGSTVTPIKYYIFNGQRIAMRRGSTLSYLHGDHLGSTVQTTTGTSGSRRYHAYGSVRTTGGTLPTDRTFTGQKQDSTGLLYYNARYYDPSLNQWIQPDTIVPDPGNVLDYNRYIYARANPLKYVDPSGHDPVIPNPYGWFAELLGIPDTRRLGEQLNLDEVASITEKVGAKIHEVVDKTGQVVAPIVESALSLFPGYDLVTSTVGQTVTGESLSGPQRVASASVALLGWTPLDDMIDVAYVGRSIARTEQHHWIPRTFHNELTSRFPSLNQGLFDITEPLDAGFHRYLHGKGASGSLQDAYNGQINSWLNTHPRGTVTSQQFLDYVENLRNDYLEQYLQYLTGG